MIRIPDTVDEIDAEWLSEALGTAVTSFDREILEGGVLADVYRLQRIRYASRRGTAPESVIVKLASRSEKRREMAIGNGAYLKEVNFFRDLAGEVPLRSPKAYQATSDGSARAGRFVLVMEDLGAHSRVFDQIEDNPDAAFMKKIALEISGMHAEYWESPETRLRWLSQAEHRYVFTFDASCRESPGRLEEFVSLWQEMYGRSVFDEGGTRTSKATTHLLCGSGSGVILDRISDRLSARPHTLLHGDLRADNIFRTDPARGLSVAESQLTYIDWQLMSAGPPGLEFAQAWIHSLPPELRRKDTAVLRLYHERLTSLNAAARDYSLEMLIEDYVVGLCLWWATLVTIGANTLPDFGDPGSVRMKRLWEVSIPRTLIALDDHDCLAVIEKLANG